MGHNQSHPQAGQTVTVKLKAPIATGYDAGVTEIPAFMVEDWVDVMHPRKSWMDMEGNWAALAYAIRSTRAGLPLDDEVVYGKNRDSGMGHMIHASEIASE